MEERERASEQSSGDDSDGTARHGRSVSLSAAHYFARQVPTRRVAPAAAHVLTYARLHSCCIAEFTSSQWVGGETQEEAACRFFSSVVNGGTAAKKSNGPTKHFFPFFSKDHKIQC